LYSEGFKKCLRANILVDDSQTRDGVRWTISGTKPQTYGFGHGYLRIFREEQESEPCNTLDTSPSDHRSSRKAAAYLQMGNHSSGKVWKTAFCCLTYLFVKKQYVRSQPDPTDWQNPLAT
jgi:hypothetical protein